MSFASSVKGRELTAITRILEVFGVVEAEQMRRAFSYLDHSEYGKILARLNREGLVYWPRDAKHIAANQMIMDRCNIEDSVLCFEGFIKLKDDIAEFCAGQAPAIATLIMQKNTVDLIPVNPGNVELINDKIDDIPKETYRFLVTRDQQLCVGIHRRLQNDYVVFIDDSDQSGRKPKLYRL